MLSRPEYHAVALSTLHQSGGAAFECAVRFFYGEQTLFESQALASLGALLFLGRLKQHPKARQAKPMPL